MGYHGSFVWYELMTTDKPAAEAFYREVVGWSVADSGMPGFDYAMLSAGGSPVAGLMTLPDDVAAAGGRPGWIGYVAVDDIDTGTAEVARLGGTVHRQPDDIPGIGRFSVVADPQGAVLCLFQPDGEDDRPADPRAPGNTGWHELYAADAPAVFDFYAALFGWTKGAAIDMGPMGTYRLFAHDGSDIGGMMTKPPAVPAPFWNYYFIVEAIDAAIARLTAAGGKVLNGPMQVPGGAWIVQATDPQGAFFSLTAARR